jgi:DNA-binding response OmpR family regulator
VADDNLDMRHYLTSLLAPLGKILPAADGQAALKLARREQPDIIITDLMMPKMSGFELIRALREDKRTAQTPVLLVSSHAGEEARLQCLRAGADDYLAKPFSTREFLGRVETLLKRAHEQQKLVQESRQKDAFLAMLAHELRNPMAPLRTGVDMLMHEPALPTRAQRTLLIMHRQITALSQIVDDLLDVSRLSRGKVKLRKELMDLREVANSAVDVVRISSKSTSTNCS